MRSNQATTLGYGKRFNYDFVKRAKEQPGAGEYVKDSNACGKQPLSIKKSMQRGKRGIPPLDPQQHNR